MSKCKHTCETCGFWQGNEGDPWCGEFDMETGMNDTCPPGKNRYEKRSDAKKENTNAEEHRV